MLGSHGKVAAGVPQILLADIAKGRRRLEAYRDEHCEWMESRLRIVIGVTTAFSPLSCCQ
jgi:hypothetical protein